MLEQCANTPCTAVFRTLREGKLFVFPRQAPPSPDEPAAITCAWLCEACSHTTTAAFIDGEIQIMPIEDFDFERYQVAAAGVWVSICRTCSSFVAAAPDEPLLAIPEGAHVCADAVKKPPASIRFGGRAARLNGTLRD